MFILKPRRASLVMFLSLFSRLFFISHVAFYVYLYVVCISHFISYSQRLCTRYLYIILSIDFTCQWVLKPVGDIPE